MPHDIGTARTTKQELTWQGTRVRLHKRFKYTAPQTCTCSVTLDRHTQYTLTFMFICLAWSGAWHCTTLLSLPSRVHNRVKSDNNTPVFHTSKSLSITHYFEKKSSQVYIWGHKLGPPIIFYSKRALNCINISRCNTMSTFGSDRFFGPTSIVTPPAARRPPVTSSRKQGER